MKLITRNDIEHWSKRFDAKGNFPILISRLIRATTPQSTQIDIPSGSAAYIGGWDGIVICKEDTPYIPKGISLLEFGTEDNPKGKADRDYKKRSADALGYNPSESTFIFITSKFWKNKDKWRQAKLKDGVWKDIKVYDSSSLEQWLEIALSVSRWFSSQIGNYPLDGIQTADEFWEEWSSGPKTLFPEIITSGREFEQRKILEFLLSAPGIKAVRASTKNEAVAFIIATAKLFEKKESERFFSKTLIIDTESNFRGIRINNIVSPLNLIPRFDNTQPLYAAISNGHHVIIPLGADDNFNQDLIDLPIIDGRGQVLSFVKSGYSSEDAEKFSREAGRNITILKRLIGFPSFKVKWTENKNIRELIPVLLVGRWNESFSGDIKILEKISGKSYIEYSQILSNWLTIEESPIIKIGETWRLTSPLDTWTNIASYLTKNDLQKLSEVFLNMFKSGNPTIKPENKVLPFYTKKKKYSNWLREGLTQSLILIGLHGERLRLPEMVSPQSWVDKLVNSVLYKASGDLWAPLDYELSLIAEASPTSFLNAVKESLSHEQPPIIKMFEEEDGFLFSTSHHTGLLWALEGLAWLPDYLYEASLILLKLARLDPGGHLANRPINSIVEIFKPWHHQTLANFDERMSILKRITKDEAETGWELLLRMLPEYHGIAQSTHKMRWRMFDKNTNLKYTYKEIRDTHSKVIDLLIDLFDYDEHKFAQLIERSDTLCQNDRKKLLDWANEIYKKIEQKEYVAWHALRKILSHHRSYPDADWALPEQELKIYEELHLKLQPTGAINKYIWLFNNDWPALTEGLIFDDKDYEKRYGQHQKKIDDKRIKGLKEIIKEFGIDTILKIYNTVKSPWIFGSILARIVNDKKDIFLISQSLNDDDNILFSNGFFYEKSSKEGFEWIKSLYSELSEQGFSKKALANLLIPLNQSIQLWDFVASLDDEINKKYWLKMPLHFFHVSKEKKIYGIQKLIDYKRFFSAIDICSHFSEEIPSDLLTEILNRAATEKSSENLQFDSYRIERIFETIDKRNDIENNRLINLEWLYLPVLASYGSRRNPKILHDELSKNPEFFVEVLTWIYLPKNKEKTDKENETLPDNIIKNRAKQAYELLHSWKKIPGLKEDNTIDSKKLEEWVNKARELAKKENRLEVADMHIGQVLAQYPENIPEWPNEVIFEIIESINSDSLKRNYSSAIFNKRSFSTRGPYDGGDIEREHAKYFRELADKYKHKYPNVSEVFNKLSEGYLIDAKRMDEEAERNKLEY